MNFEFIAQEDEFHQILDIQKANILSSIGTSRKGFLEFEFESVDHMKRLVSKIGFVVVRKDTSIVGYNMLLTPDEAATVPFYDGLIKDYMKLGNDMSNVAVYAQCCIRKDHRGGHILRKLCSNQSKLLSRLGYKKTIGFVDSRNKISLLSMLRIANCRVVTESDKWILLERDEKTINT